ncbi:MAG TPA: MBL fold metallo-hydrolase [Gemmatimonadaceae bacterium]|nr:MBL fold metallo-hydrolase [Gemmatimonadaceae bacterium]
MRLWMLGSGSRGNAVLLESRGHRVLIDAGFGAGILARRLAAIGVSGESIDAVLITHEHLDHVRGVCAGAKRWGWSVYATAGTIAAYPALHDHNPHCLRAAETIELPAFSICAVATPHDAAEPVAFIATARATGARAGVAYDLGHANGSLRTALQDLDLLVLEANHDEGMLRAGPYPPSVRHRIAGSHGHLSNRAAAAIARECAHGQLAHLVLAHLSDSCNDPTLATRAVQAALGRTRFRGAVHVAPQHDVCGPFVARRAPQYRAAQLSLEL